MGNTNFQTIHQMGTAISDFVKQATGRDNVQNIDMDHITVAQNHRYEEVDVSGRVVSFQAGEAGLPFEKMVVQIKPVQSGSGDPSPENIRPITGWTEANVTRTGKNLLNANGLTYIDGKALDASGNEISNRNLGYVGAEIPVNGNTAYTISGTYVLAGGTASRVYFFDESKAFIGRSEMYYNTGLTFTTPQNCKYIGFQYQPIGINKNTLQLELGSTASSYSPYNGQTIPITFPSEAGTVYGGTLDMTTGELVVDRVKYIFLDGNGWARSLSYPGGFYIRRNLPEGTAKDFTPFLCSHAKSVDRLSDYVEGTCYCDGSISIRIMGSQATLEDWNTYIANQYNNGTPLEICYELETPLFFQLIPQQITTLLGQNCIWADTGDIEVKFTNVKEMY